MKYDIMIRLSGWGNHTPSNTNKLISLLDGVLMKDINPLERGIGLITIDCANCPYMRLLDYPVTYCLYGAVDYSTKCPHDYDITRAMKEYQDNADCVEYHYNLIKPFLREDCPPS